MRARVFIGSSAEAIEVARGVQRNLERYAEVTPWDHWFKSGNITYPRLEEATRQFDYAVLICQPDDAAYIRGERHEIPRGNVLMELGMFLPALGRERVFILTPLDNRAHMPSDLNGMTLLHYDSAHSDKGSAVATACDEIRKRIAEFKLPVKMVPRAAAARDDDKITTFRLKLMLEITNDTGASIVLSDASFAPSTVACDLLEPSWRGRISGGEFRCQFLKEDGHGHVRDDFLLRAGQTTTTFIAFDHRKVKEADLGALLAQKKVGKFSLVVTCGLGIREAKIARKLTFAL